MPQSKKKDKKAPPSIDYFGYLLLLALLAVTAFAQPNWTEKVSVHHVWYYGWITAISTGLGSVPFYFFPEPDKYWMGISNGQQALCYFLSFSHWMLPFSPSPLFLHFCALLYLSLSLCFSFFLSFSSWLLPGVIMILSFPSFSMIVMLSSLLRL